MSKLISEMFAAALPLTGAEGIPMIQMQDGEYVNIAATLFDAVTFAGFFFADATFYASPTGDDANDGLTALTPKTLQGALNMVSAGTIGDGVTITIQMADGTYTCGVAGFVLPYFYGPFGKAVLQGNLSNKDAVVLTDHSSLTAYGLVSTAALGFYTWTLQSFVVEKPVSAVGFGAFIASNGGGISIGDNMTMGTNGASEANEHFTCNSGSRISFDITGTNKLYLNSGADICMYSLAPGSIMNIVGSWGIDCGGSTRNFSSSFYKGEILSEGVCYNGAGAIPVSNGSITGVRANFVGNAVGKFYNTPSTNFFPGNSAMTTSTGGQIV